MLATSLRVALLTGSAALLLAGAASTQNCFYSPSDTPTTGTCNVFPWGQSSTRHQHLVTAAELGNQARTIREIAYAACTTGTFTSNQITIRMAHTTNNPLDVTFANNYATPPVTVLSSNAFSYNYVANAWADVGLQNPFAYDPALGDLLIEIEFCNGVGGSSFHRDVSPRVWFNGGGCTSPVSGTSAIGALKVRVCADPPRQVYYFSPSDTPTTGTCNVFPWGQSSTRHQHLVTAAELGNLPQTIRDIGYAACTTGTFTSNQITIRMAHTTNNPLDVTFANNYATPPVTVLSSTNFSYAYSTDAWADVGLTGSFSYNPALGNLLIEIEFCNGAGGAAFHRDVSPRVWFNGGGCTSPVSGTSAIGALKVRICTEVATRDIGGGCPGARTVGRTVIDPRPGGSFRVDCSNHPCAGGLRFLIFGIEANPPIPLPMPPACQNGCTLACLPMLVIPGVNQVLVNIPNSAPPGASICIQCGCLTANACIDLSQGLRFTVQ